MFHFRSFTQRFDPYSFNRTIPRTLVRAKDYPVVSIFVCSVRTSPAGLSRLLVAMLFGNWSPKPCWRAAGEREAIVNTKRYLQCLSSSPFSLTQTQKYLVVDQPLNLFPIVCIFLFGPFSLSLSLSLSLSRSQTIISFPLFFFRPRRFSHPIHVNQHDD